MTTDELRALAAKVEQGTATEWRDVYDINVAVVEALWGSVAQFHKAHDLVFEVDGSHRPVSPCHLLDMYGVPRFLTSIDAQSKYLPMPGWDRRSYTEEHGSTCFMKKMQSLEDRLDLTVPPNPSVQGGGLNVSREAAELACTLRAMAWEKENGK